MTEKNNDKKSDKKDILKRSKDNKKESPKEDFPSIPQEIIESLPEEHRVSLRAMFSSLSFSGKPPSPILEKVTEEHITELIDGSKKHDERQYKFAASGRKYNLTYILIFVGVFVFLTLFFGRSNESLYIEITKAIAFLAGGFAGGLGVGLSYKGTRKN